MLWHVEASRFRTSAIDGHFPSRTPVSESKPPMLLQADSEVITSSRDGWSPTRVRTADAECWVFQRAARQAAREETAARAKGCKGHEPGAINSDIITYTNSRMADTDIVVSKPSTRFATLSIFTCSAAPASSTTPKLYHTPATNILSYDK